MTVGLEDNKKKEELWNKVVAAVVTVYTTVVFLVAITLLVAIWPTNSAEMSLNSTRTLTIPPAILDVKATLGPETLIVVTMILAGVVGACIYSFYAVSDHLGGHNDFERRWLSWYLLRPLMGGGLAFIIYVLLRAGIFTVGSDLKSVNFLGMTGISFLVGLLTGNVMEKLHAIADSAFGPTLRKRTRDASHKDPGKGPEEVQPAPVPEE